MIGAIAGDIIGSVYEHHNIKTKDFVLFSARCFFTDDSVLTIALADSILTGTPYADNLNMSVSIATALIHSKEQEKNAVH